MPQPPGLSEGPPEGAVRLSRALPRETPASLRIGRLPGRRNGLRRRDSEAAPRRGTSVTRTGASRSGV